MAAQAVFKYLIIIAGLMILFNLSGIQTSTGLIIDKFSDFQNFKLGDIFSIGGAAISAGAVGGTIVVGLLFKRSPESALLVGYATLLLAYVADIVLVWQHAKQHAAWIGNLAALLLVPIAIGYVHAVISWWGQR